mgnify:CR=1 FL=1
MLLKKCVAEGIGTALLLAVVVGSGIMGERLAGGNVAVALLANALATGAGLVALILTFGPISGSHLNPWVTATVAFLERRPTKDVIGYVVAQTLGAVVGVGIAHFAFDLPLVQTSLHVRSSTSRIASEALATFGLLMVILNVSKSRQEAVPYAVGAYITAAYWFTSSTSFANPAVTLARSLTDTFSGIAPSSVPEFLLGQTIGGIAAVLLFRWFDSP